MLYRERATDASVTFTSTLRRSLKRTICTNNDDKNIEVNLLVTANIFHDMKKTLVYNKRFQSPVRTINVNPYCFFFLNDFKGVCYVVNKLNSDNT